MDILGFKRTRANNMRNTKNRLFRNHVFLITVFICLLSCQATLFGASDQVTASWMPEASVNFDYDQYHALAAKLGTLTITTNDSQNTIWFSLPSSMLGISIQNERTKYRYSFVLRVHQDGNPSYGFPTWDHGGQLSIVHQPEDGTGTFHYVVELVLRPEQEGTDDIQPGDKLVLHPTHSSEFAISVGSTRNHTDMITIDGAPTAVLIPPNNLGDIGSGGTFGQGEVTLKPSITLILDKAHEVDLDGATASHPVLASDVSAYGENIPIGTSYDVTLEFSATNNFSFKWTEGNALLPYTLYFKPAGTGIIYPITLSDNVVTWTNLQNGGNYGSLMVSVDQQLLNALPAGDYKTTITINLISQG